jgi:4-amino-4-deoxy-L-arabinose transferase-like glycosyltransferase
LQRTERIDRRAIAVLAAFLAARLAFAFALGPGIDESYTLAIARTLNLSYFDHPPLHQWIAHFAARALGEGMGARLPFIALFAATGWILYRLTSDLFGGCAGLVAAFALNVSPFFFASAGTWIVPDGPLLFGLSLAAWATAGLFFARPADRKAVWLLWLTAGAGFGVAGLSKYSAALSVAGLAAFVILTPHGRRWLTDPAPYAAAALALATAIPVFVWNAEHGWASFAFQGARGAPGAGLKPAQALVMALGEIAYLLPWIFAVLVLALVDAWRERKDERKFFLFCLALPPIVVFTLTPLWGARGLPQWTMPGWFFAYPLLGAWVDRHVRFANSLRRWAIVSCGTLAAVAALFVLQGATGFPLRWLPPRPGVADPTLEAFAWTDLRSAPLLDPPPAFVLSTHWADAGKIALALGSGVPVFVISNDPRGWAYAPDGGRLVGRDGVLVVRPVDLPLARAAAAPYFREIGEARFRTLMRNGAAAVELALVPVRGLTRGLPLPYPGAPGG